MSDTGEPAQLDELDPLDDGDISTGHVPPGALPPGALPPGALPPGALPAGAEGIPAGAAGMAAMHVRMPTGLPTPAFNPNAAKEYYRFLFCGVLIVIGCLMPFGPDYASAGYKTFTGGVNFLIGIGMIWSAWAGISVNKPSMKWIMLGFIPAFWGIMKLVEGFDAPALAAALEASPRIPLTEDWGAFFSKFVDREDPDRYLKLGNTLRYFGPGKIFVALGGVLSLVFFALGIVGGAKEIKAKKEAARAQSASRRRK